MPELMPEPTGLSPLARAADRAADFMRGHERSLLAAALAFQIAVLAGMIALKGWTLATGQTIYVRVVPVDPRDLMRGDYVILSYEFSVLRGGLIDGRPLDGAWRPDTVYAVLQPAGDGKHWQLSHFTARKPDGGVFLRGTVDGVGRIDYGISSYFVQEGKGLAYEEAMRSRRLSAEIAVDSAGAAVLKALHIDG